MPVVPVLLAAPVALARVPLPKGADLQLFLFYSLAKCKFSKVQTSGLARPRKGNLST